MRITQPNRGQAKAITPSGIATAIEAGETVDLNQLLSAEAQRKIAVAFKQTGWANLVGAHELLSGKYEYGELRVFRAAANYKQT